MKKISKLQIGLVLVAFLATAGLLFGGQALTTKIKVDNPLQHEIKSIKGVQTFSIVTVKDGLQVKLKLKQVQDLQQVLELVKQKVQFYHEKPVTSILIEDHSDQRLREVRYQLSFYLEEAVASGHYIPLKQALDSYQGVLARVYFSQDQIYIQLEEGKHYLYEVLPKQMSGIKPNEMTGGGSV